MRGKRNSRCGANQAGIEREAERAELVQRLGEILLDVVRQHELVVQPGAPADQPALIGLLPEGGDGAAHQQHLRRRHPGMRRHLQRPVLDQAEPAGAALGRVHLVDAELGAVGIAGHVGEDVAEQPVDQPGRRLLVRRDLGEGDLQLGDAVLPRLIDARMLAGRADEEAAEQVGEARVVVPEAQQRLQQVRPAQEGAVLRAGRAHDHVVAAAGADMAAVEHEFLGRQAELAGFLVQHLGPPDMLGPAGAGVDVHLDHAGVGGDGEALQPLVARRQVAFQHHLAPGLGARSPRWRRSRSSQSSAAVSGG